VSAFNPPLQGPEVHAALGGRYRVGAPLGDGGQGDVFRAFLNGGTPPDELALKVYCGGQVLERAAREVAALRTVRGPTLVALRDAGTCQIRGGDCAYMATTLIEGEPLHAAIARGPCSVGAVARIGHDTADAIDRLWAERIVHRDIKPPNIMLARSGRAVLIDLGVARHLSLTSLTTVGKTWGTEGYLSPEQMQARRDLTCKSDVFSLGVVLQEALVGRHPTGRAQAPLLNGGPRTSALRSGVPPRLAALVDAMVHRQAHARPHPQEVRAALAPFLA